LTTVAGAAYLRPDDDHGHFMVAPAERYMQGVHEFGGGTVTVTVADPVSHATLDGAVVTWRP
jgi:hypothetical protein